MTIVSCIDNGVMDLHGQHWRCWRGALIFNGIVRVSCVLLLSFVMSTISNSDSAMKLLTRSTFGFI